MLSITDDKNSASVSQSMIKKPGIIMERNAGYINLATVGGERITAIEVYDAAGRRINSAVLTVIWLLFHCRMSKVSISSRLLLKKGNGRSKPVYNLLTDKRDLIKNERLQAVIKSPNGH